MCGSKKPPTQATVDPAVERQKAADDAARKANSQLVMDSRRRRGQQGLLSNEQQAGSVLQRAVSGDKVRSHKWGLIGSVMERDAG